MTETPTLIIERLSALPSLARSHRLRTGKPLVALTYAQSLDGSIAARRDSRLALSGDMTLKVTHQLRAAHDAILVGIGTVLADNPRLTARLVDGKNPQAIVVDSQLRTPLSARLLNERDPAPLIASGQDASPESRAALESHGATVLTLPLESPGFLNLRALLIKLGEMGIDSVMVEGGSQIITSLITAQLVDWMLVTICPLLVGGLRAFENDSGLDSLSFPRLHAPRFAQMGEDCILWGDLRWGEA